jgi:hypothetical protein
VSRAAAIPILGLLILGVPPVPAPAQGPPCTVTTIRGEELRATIVALDAAAAGGAVIELRPLAAAARTLPVDELESIDCGGQAPLPIVRPGAVWLRSGTGLGARLVGGAEGEVRVEIGPRTELAFRLVHLRALRLEAADAAGDYDGFRAALDAPAATEDLLFAWNRQTGKLSRLSCRVLGVEGDQLRVDYRGERTVPIEQVHGIVFGRDNGVRPPAPPAPAAVVRTAAGGPVFGGSLLGWGVETLRLRLAEGPELELPLASIDRVELRSARVLRLSAVAPAEVVQVPAFERPRPWLVDRAPGGPGLQLGGRSFARGLCLIPRTRLTWALEPEAFDVFEATIGIDARSSGPADATFRVLLDEELVFERAHVAAGTAEPIRVPLGGATRLAVEVDFGERLDLGDHCVFADARLLRL